MCMYIFIVSLTIHVVNPIAKDNKFLSFVTPKTLMKSKWMKIYKIVMLKVDNFFTQANLAGVKMCFVFYQL